MGEAEAAERKRQDGLFEHRGVEPVPIELRFGHAISQFPMWFGANAVTPALFVGALGPIAFSLGFWPSMAAIAAGTGVSALFVGFASTMGPRTGMVQILISRYTFGYEIGRVLALFNAIYCYAWCAISLVTGTAAIRLGFALAGVTILGSTNRSYALWVGVLSVLSLAVAVLGYRFVHYWERLSAVVCLVVFGSISVALLTHHPSLGTTSVKGTTYLKDLAGMGLASFGFGLGWLSYVSDYSRKLPRSSSSPLVFLSAFSGLALAAIWIEGLGCLLTTAAFQAVKSNSVVNGIPAVLGQGNIVLIGLIIVGFSTVANNIPNVYTGGLSLQAAGIRLPRWVLTLIGGIIATAVAISFLKGFSDKFEEFLLMLSYWLGAWFVLIAYNYLRHRESYDASEWDSPHRLPLGIAPTIAFLAALVAAWFGMFPLKDVDWGVLWQGKIGNQVGVDLGFVFAIVTALVIGVLLDLVLPKSWKRFPIRRQTAEEAA